MPRRSTSTSTSTGIAFAAMLLARTLLSLVSPSHVTLYARTGVEVSL